MMYAVRLSQPLKASVPIVYDQFRKFLSPKQVQKVYEQGMKNQDRFHKEMNRRAGMKRMEGDKPGKPEGAPQGRPMPK